MVFWQDLDSAKKIEVKGKSLTMPEYYKELDTLSEDPEDTLAYMAESDYSMCFLRIFPISLSEAFPNHQTRFRNMLYGSLKMDQTLIYADADAYRAYSIIKTETGQAGIEYTLEFQRFYKDCAIQAEGYFEGKGLTNAGDHVIYEISRRNGSVEDAGETFAEWNVSKRDKRNKAEMRMGLLRKERYYIPYRGGPLTMCSEIVEYLYQTKSQLAFFHAFQNWSIGGNRCE